MLLMYDIDPICPIHILYVRCTNSRGIRAVEMKRKLFPSTRLLHTLT